MYYVVSALLAHTSMYKHSMQVHTYYLRRLYRSVFDVALRHETSYPAVEDPFLVCIRLGTFLLDR